MLLSLGGPGKNRAEKAELIHKYILVCLSLRGKRMASVRVLNLQDSLPSMFQPSLGAYRVRNLARDTWAGLAALQSLRFYKVEPAGPLKHLIQSCH